MGEQNYSNHRRYVPLYHGLTFSIIVLLLISSIYYTTAEIINHTSLKPGLFLFLISVSFLSLFYYARSFAVRAQDRAIRAEENFRYYVLTGKPLDKRITMDQIIGLRFASDEEFPDLVQKALDGNMGREDIKKAVKNWRADNHRC